MIQEKEKIFKFLIMFLLNQLEEEHLGLKAQIINELEKKYNINIDDYL